MVDRVEFVCYGQEVRCWLETERGEPVEGRSAGYGLRWHVAVDGVSAGIAGDWIASEDEIAIERRMRWFLVETGGLRVPAQPWQWSILDVNGSEWWVRLVAEEAAGRPTVPELVFLACADGRIVSHPWALGPVEPTPNVLRALLLEATDRRA